MLPHTRKLDNKRGREWFGHSLAIFDTFRAPFVAKICARDIDSDFLYNFKPWVACTRVFLQDSEKALGKF